LSKVGIEVLERTVSRLLRRPRRPPSQTWRTFLTNHVATLVSVDFFTVSTLTGRILFVFVVLLHHRRGIVHVNVTDHPTAAWTAQQMIEAFPDDSTPRWLMRDRDAIYGHVFRRRVAAMGIGEVLSSPARPWQNPYAERVIGSIRQECLDHVTVLSDRHLRRMLNDYVAYYHRARPHLSLAKDAPTPRPAQDRTAGGPRTFNGSTSTGHSDPCGISRRF
jgi:putative transposase